MKPFIESAKVTRGRQQCRPFSRIAFIFYDTGKIGWTYFHRKRSEI